MEALDEDIGIGLRESASFAGHNAQHADSARRRDAILAGLIVRAASLGSREVVLSTADIKALEPQRTDPLPSAIAVLCTLLRDNAAGDVQDFRLLYHSTSGPSGANLLGRFAHLDERLAASLVQHTQEEENLEPSVIFAEVVHLPNGRVGNIAARPILRKYEIPFHGRSGVHPSFQILPDDLTVRIRNGRLELRSKRLNSAIKPRLSCAHNFNAVDQIPLYRFLGLMQLHGYAHSLSWSWGMHAATASFLPRVVVGRIVLARARWLLSAAELGEAMKDLSRSRRAQLLLDCVGRLGIPRFVSLAEADHELSLDMTNVLSQEMLLAAVRRSGSATLYEDCSEIGAHIVTSPGELYANELVVPFVVEHAGPKGGTDITQDREPSRIPSNLNRSCHVGSEWVYAKLYCGSAHAERVISGVIKAAAEYADCTSTPWFFIRYADPDHHIRLRIAASSRTRSAVIDEVISAAAPALESGLLARLTFDTYEREVERYGGSIALPLCEKLFWSDSRACLTLHALGSTRGERAIPTAMLSAHQILDDLRIQIPERVAILDHHSRAVPERKAYASWYRSNQPMIITWATV